MKRAVGWRGVGVLGVVNKQVIRVFIALIAERLHGLTRLAFLSAEPTAPKWHVEWSFVLGVVHLGIKFSARLEDGDGKAGLSELLGSPSPGCA